MKEQEEEEKWILHRPAIWSELLLIVSRDISRLLRGNPKAEYQENKNNIKITAE